jgi:hypothetical protein
MSTVSPFLAKVGHAYLCGTADCVGQIPPRDVECAFPVTVCAVCTSRTEAIAEGIRREALEEAVKTLLRKGIATNEVVEAIRGLQ